MIFVFRMLSFKPTFSLSSFTFIKRLFSSSLSTIRVVSSAYLRLLIFLPAILIPACASSSPTFLMKDIQMPSNFATSQGNSEGPFHLQNNPWTQLRTLLQPHHISHSPSAQFCFFHSFSRITKSTLQ